LNEEINISSIDDNSQYQQCLVGRICYKDILIDEKNQEISKLKKDVEIFYAKYEEIENRLDDFLKGMHTRIKTEIELAAIQDNIFRGFYSIINTIAVYISKKDKLYDIIVIVKKTDFKKKYEISRQINKLMREYKNYYFDCLIFDENEIKSIDIDETQYTKFEIGR